MAADIVTLTGAPKNFSFQLPTLRLARDEADTDAALIAPLSDALFKLGGEAVRVLCVLGGDMDEALRLIEAEIEARFTAMKGCNNE